MRSLIAKEWREHFKWAALPGILILAPMALIGVPILMEPVYLAYVSLVAGLFGALLGFLQVFPEAGGDKRSLLLHRPLSPSRIFLGKAIAGVGIYSVALLAPTLCTMGLALTPGHVGAPFEWGMTLPWLADVLTGLVYYFAGMITAQREARWYGSRCLPLAAGLFASAIVWNTAEFSHAIAAISLIGAVVACAAWGAFVAGGSFEQQPRSAKIALGSTLLMGLSALVFAAKLLIGTEFVRPIDYFPFEMSRWGQVLIVEKENWWQDGKIWSITDLSGRAPEELKGERLDAFAFRKVIARGATAGLRPKSITYRSVNRFIQEFKNKTTPSSEIWWHVPARGEFVGFDKDTKNVIGRFGPDGFVERDERVRAPFKGNPLCYLFGYKSELRYPLAFPDGAYTVDFRKGVVQRVFAPPPGETVIWASEREDERAGWSHIFSGTEKKLYVFDGNGNPICSAPLPIDMKNYRLMAVGRLDNPRRFWIWYTPHWELPLAEQETLLEVQTVIYDDAGREIPPRETVTPRPGVVRDFPAGQPAVGPNPLHVLSGLASSPVEASVLIGTIAALKDEARRHDGLEVTMPLQFLGGAAQLFMPGITFYWRAHPALVFGFAGLMLLACVISGLACFMLPRRYALSLTRCFGWAVCGLSFGLTGLLLLLTLRQWPARIACPNCRKLRVVTREQCEHCGAAHALPEADGTEIFEENAPVPPPVLACR
jgi:hypothetical protein